MNEISQFKSEEQAKFVSGQLFSVRTGDIMWAYKYSLTNPWPDNICWQRFPKIATKVAEKSVVMFLSVITNSYTDVAPWWTGSGEEQYEEEWGLFLFGDVSVIAHKEDMKALVPV